MKRPHSGSESWVYGLEKSGQYWGTLIDGRIRYRTLFQPGSDQHDELDEVILPLDGRYWVKVGDWARTLVPGEAAIIPRKTQHDSGVASNLVGSRYLVLLLDVSLIGLVQ